MRLRSSPRLRRVLLGTVGTGRDSEYPFDRWVAGSGYTSFLHQPRARRGDGEVSLGLVEGGSEQTSPATRSCTTPVG